MGSYEFCVTVLAFSTHAGVGALQLFVMLAKWIGVTSSTGCMASITVIWKA